MSDKLDDLLLCYHEHFGVPNVSDAFYNSQKYRNYVSDTDRLGRILWPVQEAFCAVSVIVACVNVFVLTRPSMRASSFNLLLVALECVNITSALAQLYFFLVYIYHGLLTSSYVLFLTQNIAITIDENCIFLTNWLTVVIGAWRLVAILNPLKVAHILTRRKAVAILFVLFLNMCVHVSFAFATHEIEEHWVLVCSDAQYANTTVRSLYHLGESSWASQNYIAYGKIELSFLILNLAVPAILFAGITSSLVWNISRTKSRRQSLQEGQEAVGENGVRSNVLLILYLWMFVGCSMFIFASELNLLLKRNDLVDKALMICLQYLPNSVTNCTSFFVYYFMCSKFRTTCRKCFSRNVNNDTNKNSSRSSNVT